MSAGIVRKTTIIEMIMDTMMAFSGRFATQTPADNTMAQMVVTMKRVLRLNLTALDSPDRG